MVDLWCWVVELCWICVWWFWLKFMEEQMPLPWSMLSPFFKSKANEAASSANKVDRFCCSWPMTQVEAKKMSGITWMIQRVFCFFFYFFWFLYNGCFVLLLIRLGFDLICFRHWFWHSLLSELEKGERTPFCRSAIDVKFEDRETAKGLMFRWRWRCQGLMFLLNLKVRSNGTTPCFWLVSKWHSWP